MIFGYIDYINLIPFYTFLKYEIKGYSAKTALNYYKNVPSKITDDFIKKRVDSGVISSVVSKRYKCTDFGIIAKGKVYSVLACKNGKGKDLASKTSNSLAKVLNINGKVIIGDKALQLYFKGENCQDLSEIWFKRYNLPFVFARLCTHKNLKFYQKLTKKFFKTNRKRVPYYIILNLSKKSGLTPKQIYFYLDRIEYKIDYKAKKGLKLFLRLNSQK